MQASPNERRLGRKDQVILDLGLHLPEAARADLALVPVQTDPKIRLAMLISMLTDEALQVAAFTDRRSRMGRNPKDRKQNRDKVLRDLRSRLITKPGTDGRPEPVIGYVTWGFDPRHTTSHYTLVLDGNGRQAAGQLPTMNLTGSLKLPVGDGGAMTKVEVQPMLVLNGLGGYLPLMYQSGMVQNTQGAWVNQQFDWETADHGMAARQNGSYTWTPTTRLCCFLQPPMRDGKPKGRVRAVMLELASQYAIDALRQWIEENPSLATERELFPFQRMSHGFFSQRPVLHLQPIGAPGIPFYKREWMVTRDDKTPDYEDVLSIAFGHTLRLAQNSASRPVRGPSGYGLGTWEVQLSENSTELIYLGEYGNVPIGIVDGTGLPIDGFTALGLENLTRVKLGSKLFQTAGRLIEQARANPSPANPLVRHALELGFVDASSSHDQIVSGVTAVARLATEHVTAVLNATVDEVVRSLTSSTLDDRPKVKSILSKVDHNSLQTALAQNKGECTIADWIGQTLGREFDWHIWLLREIRKRLILELAASEHNLRPQQGQRRGRSRQPKKGGQGKVQAPRVEVRTPVAPAGQTSEPATDVQTNGIDWKKVTVPKLKELVTEFELEVQKPGNKPQLVAAVKTNVNAYAKAREIAQA